jgi:uncharacterized protein (TIRG00374 family)
MAISKTTRKYIFILCKICVAAACMVWVGLAQDWAQIRKIFSELNILSLSICGILFIVSQIIVAVRWNFLLRAQSIRIKNITAIKLQLLGLFYNNFLPGSIGGDFLRAWYISKHTDKRVEAAFSVFVDRALGTLAMVFLAVAGYVFIASTDQFVVSNGSGTPQSSGISRFYPFIFIIAGILLAVVLVFVSLKSGRVLIKKVWNQSLVVFSKLLISFKIYAKRPVTVFFALLLTYFSQSMNIIGFWLLGRSMGIEVGLQYYLIFFPISWVVGAIPISIGGIGIIEGLLTFLFVSVGASPEHAFALSLCQRAFLLLISLPGVWIHIVGAHLPGEEFFIDSDQSIV